jgi:hypothetical protein
VVAARPPGISEDCTSLLPSIAAVTGNPVSIAKRPSASLREGARPTCQAGTGSSGASSAHPALVVSDR